MRRSVFKREIESVVCKNNLSPDERDKLLNALFVGMKTDTSEEYLLKDAIKHEDDIRNVLTSFSNKSHVINDIVEMFCVSGDLSFPLSFRESLDNNEPIALFVGAGVSKICGIPLWGELAYKALEYLFAEEQISFKEKERLQQLGSPKSILSIFHQTFIHKKEKVRDFYTKALKCDENKPNPYKYIAKLSIPVISTNVDNELWRAKLASFNQSASEDQNQAAKFPPRIDHKFSSEIEIDANGIYQIHGSLDTIGDYQIMTMSDYLENYYRPTSELPAFLKKVSSKYRLIFLGCGMEEMEILGPIVSKEKRHLVVIGTYIGERRYYELQKVYYDKHLKMDTHGFYLDFKGYERLNVLIDQWVKNIQSDIYTKLGEIDAAEL